MRVPSRGDLLRNGPAIKDIEEKAPKPKNEEFSLGFSSYASQDMEAMRDICSPFDGLIRRVLFRPKAHGA